MLTKKLFTPGPVAVKTTVLKELAKPILFHRTKPFEKVYAEVSTKLNKVFGADDNYASLIMSGSGTMANEAVATSLINRNQKLLIVSNGQFGERLATIAKIHKVRCEVINFGWANPINISDLQKKIILYKPDWLFVTLLETSTGMANPVNEIGKICKKHKVSFFVDAVSGLGAETISMIKDNISACTSVPNKALEAPPGLSFVCVKKTLVTESEEVKSFYLDLCRYYVSSLKNQTPTTPALPIFVSLNKALDLLTKEGLQGRRKRYLALSSEVVRLSKTLKIPVLITDKKYKAIAITTLVLPSHEIAEKLSLHLLKKGMTVWHHNYKQEDPRMNSLMQISVMGDINISDIKRLFKEIADFNTYGKK